SSTTGPDSGHFCAAREIAWHSWVPLAESRTLRGPMPASVCPPLLPARGGCRSGDATQRLARSVGASGLQLNQAPGKRPRVDPQKLTTVGLNPRGVLAGWKLAPLGIEGDDTKIA